MKFMVVCSPTASCVILLQKAIFLVYCCFCRYPEYNFIASLDHIRISSVRKQRTTTEGNEAIALDVKLLQECDLAVVTFSSNVN